MNVFIARRGTHFLFLFAFTAAGVVQCGDRTSTIVRFIFYFWSFEISVNILRNQNYRTTSMLKSVVICHTSLYVLGKRWVWCYR